MQVPEKVFSNALNNAAELARALDEIEHGPEPVIAAVSALSESQLRFKPDPKKWSALEILAHLADIEIVYGFRLRQILAQPGSTLTPIDQDAWAARLDYSSANPCDLIERYRCLRRANLALLRKLTVADLAKAAFHPEYDGDFSLADLVTFMRGHDANHLRQIERLKQQFEASTRS
jgi:hypothetical protein